jgi:cysteine desulfurase
MSIDKQTRLKDMPIYLDCNATTPLAPEVKSYLVDFYATEVGNPGSRTHIFGQRAKQIVQNARRQISKVIECQPSEVVFTSGATESNNLALLGLMNFGRKVNKRHVISTHIEHKSILEPLKILEKNGFEISLLSASKSGYVDPDELKMQLREDTLCVSIMHVNNETGIIQPIECIATHLNGSEAIFHVDASQGFGKHIPPLKNKRIDLISISSHKIYGPTGVGALISRLRNGSRLPIEPLIHGGDQEWGLRSGSLPTALIAAFGIAAEISERDFVKRFERCKYIQELAIRNLSQIGAIFHGDHNALLPNVINFSIPGIDSEALMIILKEEIAISNGSACNSSSYTASHVLSNMGLDEDALHGSVRASWCYMTPDINWENIVGLIKQIKSE